MHRACVYDLNISWFLIQCDLFPHWQFGCLRHMIRTFRQRVLWILSSRLFVHLMFSCFGFFFFLSQAGLELATLPPPLGCKDCTGMDHLIQLSQHLLHFPRDTYTSPGQEEDSTTMADRGKMQAWFCRVRLDHKMGSKNRTQGEDLVLSSKVM